jgi:DNA-binding transcriptional regulator YhcF (GntR family)
MTISSDDKLREAARIAALKLPGRALDLAVLLLRHLNFELGVAWPGVEDLADELGISTQTIGRATAILADAGVAKFAKRRGAAARWFPNLMDMEPEEAKRRVAKAIKNWKHDRSKMRDHEAEAVAGLTGIPLDDPSKMSPIGPSTSVAQVRDLKSTSNRLILNAATAANARLPPTEAAFNLVDQLAKIAGLSENSIQWPEPWRHAAPLVQSWLTDLSERPFATGTSPAQLCVLAAKGVMKSETAREGARRTIKYFEPAIKALADKLDAQTALLLVERRAADLPDRAVPGPRGENLATRPVRFARQARWP